MKGSRPGPSTQDNGEAASLRRAPRGDLTQVKDRANAPLYRVQTAKSFYHLAHSLIHINAPGAGGRHSGGLTFLNLETAVDRLRTS